MRLLAFGGAAVGQLGVASVKDQYTQPVEVEGNAWKKVKCGGYHTVGLTVHGTLFVWGAGWNGQLGLGKNVQKQLTPRAVTILEGDQVAITKVSCGASHTLVITADRRVYSWGGSEVNDFGLHHVSNFPNGVMIKSVAAGNAFSLALSVEGHVYSWGSGLDGRLGVGSIRNFRNPQKVSFSSNTSSGEPRVAHIATGKAFSLAVTDKGHVYSWGSGGKGQLGLGDEESKLTPELIEKLQGIQRIAAGEAHSVALDDKGVVWIWGDGEHGQLGFKNVTTLNRPAVVNTLPEDLRMARIAAGNSHTLAISDYGDVFVWGSNAFGQLGLGGTDNKSTPEYVDTLPGQLHVAKMAAGERHTMLLVTDFNRFDNANFSRYSAALAPPPKPVAPPAKRRSVKAAAGSLDDAFAEMERDLLALEEGMEGEEEGEEGGGGKAGGGAVVQNDLNKSDTVISLTESSSILPVVAKRGCCGCIIL